MNTKICEFDTIEERPLAYNIRIERDVFVQQNFDSLYGYGIDNGDGGNGATLGKGKRRRRVCCDWIRRQCTATNFRLFLFTHLPILSWLPNYSLRRDLIYDIISGLTVAVMHIPQGMAYGLLAGLDPINGLYTSFFPSLVYVFLGTSRHISIGTFAVISVMMGSVRDRFIPRDDANSTADSLFASSTSDASPIAAGLQPAVTPVELATAITFLVGIILLCMGTVRLGFLSDFLSDALISGFTSGAAVHVLVSQFPSLLGLQRPKCGEIGKLVCTTDHMIGEIAHTNLATLAIGVTCIAAVYAVKDWISPFVKRKTSVPLPAELIVIALGTATSYFADFNARFGVHIVGRMPTGLPPLALPRVDLIPLIIADSVSIAIVIFSVTVSVGKIFAKKHNYRIDPSQELLALGFVQCFCSTLGCIPSSGSLARSLLFESTGTRTQIAAVISCGVILVVLLWLGPLFYYLPQCILASVIIVALKGILAQCGLLKALFKFSKPDAFIWISSFIAVLCFGVSYGLAAAVMVELLTVVLRLRWANATVLSWIPDTELYKDARCYSRGQDVYGVKIFRFSAPLNFLNVERFRNALLNLCDVDIGRMKAYLRTCPAFPPSPPPPAAAISHLESPTSAASENISSLPICTLDETTCDDSRDKCLDITDQSIATTSTNVSSPGAGVVSLRSLELDPHGLEYIVIDCSMFGYVDSMGLNALKEVYQELSDVGLRVLFASCHASLRPAFEASDFHGTVPRDRFYITIHDAVIFATGGNIIGLTRSWSEN